MGLFQQLIAIQSKAKQALSIGMSVRRGGWFQGVDGLQKALIEEELVQDKAQESMDKSWPFSYFPPRLTKDYLNVNLKNIKHLDK